MSTPIKQDKPWDARLAYRLVYPLRHSRLSPNHLTSLRLCCGLLAAGLFTIGEYDYSNCAALAFVVSNFLDHADGELARITHNNSKLGHYYDLVSDAAINTLLFIGIGLGLGVGEPGNWYVIMGVTAGLSVSCIFHLRNHIEQHVGKSGARQPHYAGFEAEDILYLLPLVTLFDGLEMFLFAAAIGAPGFALFVIYQYLNLTRVRS